MKRIFCTLVAMVAIAAISVSAMTTRKMTLYDKVVFYNGYNQFVGESEYPGIVRLANHLYTMKLTEEQLDWSGEEFTMKVYIDALCDNYDRIGSVALALTPKGAERYDLDTTPRMEIGRFITPFMDKNKEPTRVPYEFKISNVSYILHDKALREKYDFWLEFEVFGISGAAQQQIQGCADRDDVFAGTIEWHSDDAVLPLGSDIINVPIVIRRPENDTRKNFNNYTEGATDTIGVTTKTWRFNLEKDVNWSMLTLISSNHGAGDWGEEYIRRLHLVYFDGELVLTYVPSVGSCEPYRVYNTQGNCIYGTERKTDWDWDLSSNWCPGAIIPIRSIIFEEEMKAGEHEIMIRVPEAEFYGKDGDFPISMYFQGLISGTSFIDDVIVDDDRQPEISFVRDGDNLVALTGTHPIIEVQIVGYDGRMIRTVRDGSNRIVLEDLAPGTYVVALFTADGMLQTTKFVR